MAEDEDAMRNRLARLERETEELKRRLSPAATKRGAAAPAASENGNSNGHQENGNNLGALPTPRGNERGPKRTRRRVNNNTSGGNNGNGNNGNNGHPNNNGHNNGHNGHNGNNNGGEGEEESSNGRVKWVSADDDAKSVGRFICGAAFDDAVHGFPVMLHAKNDSNVNTTMKAIAIAAKRCSEELETDIACRPSFRESRSELTVTCVALEEPIDMLTAIMNTSTATSEGDNKEEDDEKVLSVARGTDYRVLAGAIAKRTRHQSPSILRAIGAASVFTAVRALATSREYLNNENDNLDILAVPRFSKVKFFGRDDETTILEIVVLPCSFS